MVHFIRKFCVLFGGTGVLAAGGCCYWFQNNFSTSDHCSLAQGSSVLVVGSGLIGIMTAYELAGRGLKVKVLEEHLSSGFGASYGNAGTAGVTSKPYPLASWSMLKEIIMNSVSSFFTSSDAPVKDEFATYLKNKFLQPSSFCDPFFWKWSLCFLRALCNTEVSSIVDNHWLSMNQENQDQLLKVISKEFLQEKSNLRYGRFDIHKLSHSSETENIPSAEMKSVLSKSAFTSGLSDIGKVQFHPSDIVLDSHAFCNEMELLCKQRGVEFLFGETVSNLKTDDTGHKVIGLKTSRGLTFVADAYVIAGGSHTAQITNSIGLYLPIHPLRGYSVTADVLKKYESNAPSSTISVSPFGLYISRLGNSKVRCACFGEFVSISDQQHANPALTRRLHNLIKFAVPELHKILDWNTCEEWMGNRPLTPDVQPIVSSTKFCNLFVNAGHSFNGVRNACFSAVHLANIMMNVKNEESRKDLYDKLYSVERFKLFR